MKREQPFCREYMHQRVEPQTADLAQMNVRLQHIADSAPGGGVGDNVQAIGALLLEAFGRHIQAVGGSLYLKEEGGLRLVHALDRGHAADFIPFPLPGQSLFQLAIMENRPLLMDHIGENKTVRPSGWQGYTDGSALVFLLPDAFGDLAGILTLHSKQPPPFMDLDRESGTMLASYSGEVLRAVRANEALRENRSHLHCILVKDKLPLQAQKMEALRTLAGGMAHDFNNSLSAVLGYSELGLQDVEDQTHPLYAKFNAIYHAGCRARDLVEQILTFSRVGKQPHFPIKIAPIVTEALKSLQSFLPAAIEIKKAIMADRPVLGDPLQIRQVIMNLCTNACHAMQETGGILKVSLEQVTVDASKVFIPIDLPAGQYLRLGVADTGSGINPAIIDRIFDPYFTTKGKSKGTGLGLAVVYGIVNRHGGEIAVESQVGQGTRVSVWLPIAGDEPAETDSIANR